MLICVSDGHRCARMFLCASPLVSIMISFPNIIRLAAAVTIPRMNVFRKHYLLALLLQRWNQLLIANIASSREAPSKVGVRDLLIVNTAVFKTVLTQPTKHHVLNHHAATLFRQPGLKCFVVGYYW